MKLPFWIVSCLFGIMACQNSDPILPGPNHFSQVPLRVKTIRQQANYGNPKLPDLDFNAVYRYDSLGRVIFIENYWSGYTLEYQYRSDKLVTRLTYAFGKLAFLETFEYDAQGKLIRLNWNGNGSLRVKLFRYNADNRIEEIHSEFPNSRFPTARLERYVWKNSNVVAMNEFDGAGKPQSEWTYGYDSAINPYALMPADPDVPTSRNNQIGCTLQRDYTGLIDLAVNPLVIKHAYTANGLPFTKSYNYSGRRETFVYEARR